MNKFRLMTLILFVGFTVSGQPCSCPVGNSQFVPTSDIAFSHFGGKLLIGAQDSTYFINFNTQLDFIRTNYKDFYSEVELQFKNHGTIVAIYLYNHPAIMIGGNGVKNKEYIIDMGDLSKLSDCNSLTSDSWYSTQCYALVHELIEAITGSHNRGIDWENKFRVEVGVKSMRDYETACLDRKGHCDYLIPIGNNFEVLHMNPTKAEIDSISYLQRYERN